MGTDKQQTAVEWIEDNIHSDMTFMEVLRLIEQALEMEKQQQDEFAIGFAEWCNENYEFYHGDAEYYSHTESKWYKAKELLEIYKKQNGL
jgi:hypothetical protein